MLHIWDADLTADLTRAVTGLLNDLWKGLCLVVVLCILARHAALPYLGLGMGNKQVGNVRNRHSSNVRASWRAEGDEWRGRWGTGRGLGEERQRICVCKSQMSAQPSLAGAAGTWFGGEQEPLLTSEGFPFVRLIHQEARWEFLCPPHPTCPGLCTLKSSWSKMQICPWDGEELLNKGGCHWSSKDRGDIWGLPGFIRIVLGIVWGFS